jgi:outer membrane murein-binding lipoprotein Lpp
MVALIGADWADLKDEEGNRRLDNPNDFVRFEIAQALSREIPVLPILIDGARMPRAAQLPENIVELTRFQALPLRPESFVEDASVIARRVRMVLARNKRGVSTLVVAAAVAFALIFGAIIGAVGFGLLRPSPVVQDQTLKAELESTTSERDEARKLLSNANSDAANARATTQRLQDQLTTMTRARDDAQKELSGARTDLAGAKSSVQQLQDKLAALTRDLDKARADSKAASRSDNRSSEDVLRENLIKGALLSFNDANVTANYNVFHAKLSKVFRDQFSPQRLATIFKEFRDKKIDFNMIAAKTPISVEEPKVDDKGLLLLKGYFDTSPSRVNYDLAFIMSEGEWKLTKINVDVKKPD